MKTMLTSNRSPILFPRLRTVMNSMTNDPDDRSDIYRQDPDKVQELSRVIDEWLEKNPMIFPLSP